MPDLRRQVLESGKTVSRKARSRIASGASSRAGSATNSPAASRAASRNVSQAASRAGSDEDDGFLSDGTTWSTNSIDDVLASHDDDVALPGDAWKAELEARADQIVDRKRSSSDGRADSLNAFAHLLMARYACDEIQPRVADVLPAIVRSIKAENSEREAVTALRALTVLIVTLDSDTIYRSVAELLKRTASDSASIPTKVSALRALGTAAFFGGASEDDALDVMDFLLAIVESDGLEVYAHDSGPVVVAAIEEWGLLATEMDDLEDATEAAIESLVDQLQSSDAAVQIAAGETIALLYERSYTPLEEDEELDDDEGSNGLEDGDDAAECGGEKMVKRYTVYRRTDQLLHTLDDLATISGRGVSKRDRKALHSSFADVRATVERPTRGPKYSTALGSGAAGNGNGADADADGVPDDDRRALGYRIKVKLSASLEVRIDRWWKLLRLQALRRVLHAGFVRHYDHNEAVSRCLPFSMRAQRVSRK